MSDFLDCHSGLSTSLGDRDYHVAQLLAMILLKESLNLGTYNEAVRQVQATTVFTTHTPVPAGHDVFPFSLMDKYFSHDYPLLGLKRDAFLQLGISPKEPIAGFNMTAFALRMSACRNGVSKRRGEVARRMWQVHYRLKRKLIDFIHEHSTSLGRRRG